MFAVVFYVLHAYKKQRDIRACSKVLYTAVSTLKNRQFSKKVAPDLLHK